MKAILKKQEFHNFPFKINKNRPQSNSNVISVSYMEFLPHKFHSQVLSFTYVS